MIEPIAFKYKLTTDGTASWFRSKPAELNEQGLQLFEETIPFEHIWQTEGADNLVLMVLDPETVLSEETTKHVGEGNALILQVSGVAAATLAATIDRHASAAQADKRRQELTEQGKGDQYRVATCPQCQATIDLSEMDPSTYIFCTSCNSVFQEGGTNATDGSTYQHCEQCGMFDRIKSYTEFYFYFLLVFYGFSSKKVYVCDRCAHGLFLKTLAANALFILGVPNAIIIKLRSMSGRDPSLQQLAKANSLAIKGKIDEAVPIYREMHTTYKGHPGLLFNEAIGYFEAERQEEGVKMLEASLNVCSNYWPTIQLINQNGGGENGSQ